MDWVGIYLLDFLAVHIKSARKSDHGAELTNPKVNNIKHRKIALTSILFRLLRPSHSCGLPCTPSFHLILLTLHSLSRVLPPFLSFTNQSSLFSSRFPPFPIGSLLIFTLTLHLTTDLWRTQLFEWVWSGFVAIFPRSGHLWKQDSCCMTFLSSALK